MTEPIEKTYYMRVYEKCTACGRRGYYNWTVSTTGDGSCPHCHGEGYVKGYISLVEWTAQTREPARPLNEYPKILCLNPDDVTYEAQNTTCEPLNTTFTRITVPSEDIERPYHPWRCGEGGTYNKDCWV